MSWLEKQRQEAILKVDDTPLIIKHGLMRQLSFPKICFKQLELEDSKIELPKVSGILIADLNDALSAHAEAKRWFASTIKPEDTFSAFHLGYWKRGIFIHAPRDSCGEINLNAILRKSTTDHILIVADSGSKIVVNDVVTGNPEYAGKVVEIIAKDNSTVEFVSVNLMENTLLFNHKQAMLGNAAVVNWKECILSEFAVGKTINHLNGDASSSFVSGVYVGKSSQFDIDAQSIHNAKQTNSLMHSKSALYEGKGMLTGLVKINSNAHGSNGYQKSEVLLIGGAEANAVPRLEIDNHDVKCSHAASVTRVDEEKLFYLCSRGMNRGTAVSMLVNGFLSNALDNMPKFKQMIVEKVAGK